MAPPDEAIDVVPHSPRGMWRASHLSDGYPVIDLIDSKGRKIASVTLVRGVSPAMVRRMFREILDVADPKKPRLRLEKP